MSPKRAAKEIIGVYATSSIEPDYGHLMELFPVRVLIGTPANWVIILLVVIQPSIVSPSLVALSLSPVVFLSEISLDTLKISINIRRDLPICTDVLEVLGVLGIEEIVQVLSSPDV